MKFFRTAQFRADRLATLYFFRPLGHISTTVSPRVPILMYHSVSTGDESRCWPYFRTVTHPRVFRRHLEILSRNGYRTATLAAAGERLRNRSAVTEKLAALTFDDGYADFCSEAFPLLTRYGYTATVFLPTAYIADQPRTFDDKGCLTWSQVRDLHRAGVEFGSHTVTHPQLSELPDAEVERELRDSKTEIEDRTGTPVVSFAYPYAFPGHRGGFKRNLDRLLAQAGYQTGVCTTVGTSTSRSHRFFLERLPINTLDDDALFEAKLEGAYNWLRPVQGLYKLCKGWRR
jgi:peptidoglycan/xylan/chitin deacetylase (PgdA/CDA1 family)